MNLNLTILGQSISFFIFVWFCMKYVWPPIIDGIRDTRIQSQQQTFRWLVQSQHICIINHNGFGNFTMKPMR